MSELIRCDFRKKRVLMEVRMNLSPDDWELIESLRLRAGFETTEETLAFLVREGLEKFEKFASKKHSKSKD